MVDTNTVTTSLDIVFDPLSVANLQDITAPQVTARPHAANGVLAGAFSIPSRSQGLCDVWGSGAHLWLPVALALGFEPRLVWFGPTVDGAIVQYMRVAAPRAHHCLHRARRPPPIGCKGIVFTDFDSLPKATTHFWNTTMAQFLVYHRCPLDPIPGYTPRSLQLSHLAVGGATSAIWRITLLAPTSWLHSPHLSPPSPPRRPWATISHSLDFRVRSVAA